MQHFYVFSCAVGANSVSLQRVFHGIRFKVNKGWGAAAPLFFALNSCAHDGMNAEKIRQNLVDFSVQSRKENRVRKLFFRSIFLIFHIRNCHMWHLRSS